MRVRYNEARYGRSDGFPCASNVCQNTWELSVFTHEYAHDLGLPDHYDTSGGGENSVNWWTLMAQSRVSAKGGLGVGTRSADISAWDKLQLGWLDYEVMVAGQRRTLDLGPHEYNSAKPQGVVVVLPKKRVTAEYGAPFAGQRMWWSGKGDDLNNTLTRELDLSGASTATATLKARYEIEADFDFLYMQVSTDGGQNWTALDGGRLQDHHRHRGQRLRQLLHRLAPQPRVVRQVPQDRPLQLRLHTGTA